MGMGMGMAIIVGLMHVCLHPPQGVLGTLSSSGIRFTLSISQFVVPLAARVDLMVSWIEPK